MNIEVTKIEIFLDIGIIIKLYGHGNLKLLFKINIT